MLSGNSNASSGTAHSTTSTSTSTSHQRQSTIFDPLPALPSRLRQATLKLVPPPVSPRFVSGSVSARLTTPLCRISAT